MANREVPRLAWPEITTFAVRLAAFAVALAVIGTLFLPWAELDGADGRTGAALPVLAFTPMGEYLFAVAPVQTGVLIGCPVAVALFATVVASAYARRRTAIRATVIVLVAANAIVYGTGDIVVSTGSGLSLVIVLSAALLVHQLLIKLRTKLFKDRRLPSLYRGLSVLTGSGRYRWREV